MTFFLQYAYPGNVRELQNMLERTCLVGGGTEEFSAARNQSDLPHCI